jgi:sulfide:quinone oxidoreductase
VVLGAGFGGLELTTILSEKFGEELDLVLIDKNDSFIFGFSKLDIMFGRQLPAEVRHYYKDITKPGVRFVQATITKIDPVKKYVETKAGNFYADILVVALGAEYDISATPGLAEAGHEFYSVEGAEKLRNILPTFKKGSVVIGVTHRTFKCPPAPSETALLLHDFLTARGIRKNCTISLVIPFGVPLPPSPETSAALLTAFEERGIAYIKDRLVSKVNKDKNTVTLDDGNELPCDLFLCIPVHRAPKVVQESGMVEGEWIPVNKKTLETSFPGVYAIGDVTSVGTPKAGVFAEGSAKVVAKAITAQILGQEAPPPYDGKGTCYVEFGNEMVGKVEVTFVSVPTPTGVFYGQSKELVAEKALFGSSRIKRWFTAP